MRIKTRKRIKGYAPRRFGGDSKELSSEEALAKKQSSENRIDYGSDPNWGGLNPLYHGEGSDVKRMVDVGPSNAEDYEKPFGSAGSGSIATPFGTGVKDSGNNAASMAVDYVNGSDQGDSLSNVNNNIDNSNKTKARKSMIRISKSVEDSAKKRWNHLTPNQRWDILEVNGCNPYDFDETWDDVYPEYDEAGQKKLVAAFGGDDVEKGLNRLSEAVVNELWRMKGMMINESTDGDVLKAIRRVSRRKAENDEGFGFGDKVNAKIGQGIETASDIVSYGANKVNDLFDDPIDSKLIRQPGNYTADSWLDAPIGQAIEDVGSGVGRAVRGVSGKIGDAADTVWDTGRKIGSGLEGFASEALYPKDDDNSIVSNKSITNFSRSLAYNLYAKKGNSMFGMLDGDVMKAVRRKADEELGPGNQQGADDFKTWEGPMSTVATFDPNEYPPQQGPGNDEGAYVNMHMQNPQTIGEGLMSRYGINDANSGELKINNDVDNYYNMESPEHAKMDQKMGNDIRDYNDLNGTNYKVDGPDTRNKPKSMRRRIRR